MISNNASGFSEIKALLNSKEIKEMEGEFKQLYDNAEIVTVT
jgi:hypothetical protein